MTIQEFHDWARDVYAPRFGINDGPGLEMVLSWFDELTKRGATIADLNDAAEKIKPERREHHRAAILGALRQLEYERSQHAQTLKYTRSPKEQASPETIRQMLIEAGWLSQRYRDEAGIKVHVNKPPPRELPKVFVPADDGHGDAFEGPDA